MPAPGVYSLPTPGAMPKPPVPAPSPGNKPPGPPQGTQTLSADLRACYPRHGVIAEYMEWVHHLTHAPPQFHLASILPVIAYEANRRRYILGNGEPLHIWSLIVSPSGIGKTTTTRYARDMHNAWGQVIHGQAWKDPWESAEGSLPGVAEALMDGHHDPSSDATNAILHHSEMSKMLRGEENLEWFCQLFDRGDLKRNLRYIQRMQKEGEDVRDTIKNAKISAVYTTTRASFQEVFREATLRGGFASRLLWFTGAITAEDLMPMQLVDEIGKGRVLRAFIEWTKRLDGLVLSSPGGAGQDRVMPLHPAAQKAHLDYFNADLRQLIVGPNEEWNSIGNRASIYSLRLSALYALVNGRAEIQEEDMVCAIALMRYLFRDLETLLPRLRPEDRFQKMKRRVEEAIAGFNLRNPGMPIPRSVILQQVRISVAEFDLVAKTLMEEDFMRELAPIILGPGRPTKHYEIVRKA